MKWKLWPFGMAKKQAIDQEVQNFGRQLIPPAQTVQIGAPTDEEIRLFHERYPNPRRVSDARAIEEMERGYRRNGGIRNQDYMIVHENGEAVFLGRQDMGNA